MNIYIKTYCPYCIRLLSILDLEKISYDVIDITQYPEQGVVMEKLSGHTGVPQVTLQNIMIYDYGTEETLVTDIRSLLLSGEQKNLTSQFTSLI